MLIMRVHNIQSTVITLILPCRRSVVARSVILSDLRAYYMTRVNNR